MYVGLEKRDQLELSQPCLFLTVICILHFGGSVGLSSFLFILY